MRLGAILGPIAEPASTKMLAGQARDYVRAGFESLWTVQAIGRGFMITDPFVALTVAATVTEHVEIGTAVIQLPLYHPVDLAHRVFSLMQLSGERLLLGVGAGSTQKDFLAFDRDYDARFRTFTSCVAQLRELFKNGGAPGVDLTPWRNVRGGPPLLFGSWGGAERAARSFDGWIASAANRNPDELAAALKRYRVACEVRDRVARGTRAIVSTIQVGRATDVGELKERLDRFAEAGFDDAVVMFLPGAPSPDSVRALVR